ncbi:hypothetical protein AC249_AIPGENE16606 [Exaiptasia diaphana]|nr:hypothetical protein AC249_AIPGENE16606 [Exaiptasia diaphana]
MKKHLPNKEVFHQILETGDKRYLIKFLNTLSPETLLGLQKWLQASEEEKENEEAVAETSSYGVTSTNTEGSEADASSIRLPPSSPMKDQSNDKEPKTKMTASSPSEGKKKFITNLIDSADKKEIAQVIKL